MAELIQGLHVDVTGKELRGLLEGRFRYHSDKVSFYEKQLESMRKVDSALSEEAAAMGKTSTRGPVESLEQAVKKHKDQTIYYDFVAKHVVVEAVYRLAENDLVRLGVQSERYY